MLNTETLKYPKTVHYFTSFQICFRKIWQAVEERKGWSRISRPRREKGRANVKSAMPILPRNLLKSYWLDKNILFKYLVTIVCIRIPYNVLRFVTWRFNWPRKRVIVIFCKYRLYSVNGRHLYKERSLTVEKKQIRFKVEYKNYYKETNWKESINLDFEMRQKRF